MLATQQLWSTLEFIGAVLTEAQRTQVWEKYMDTVRHTAVLRERRERSCPPRITPASEGMAAENQSAFAHRSG